MADIALVRHNEEVGPGRIAGPLASHEVRPVWAGDGSFPTDVAAAVVLGGFMGAYDEGAFPWLIDEKEWLRRLVDRAVPVLGICLGAQLLADALGGTAYRAPRSEVGVVDVILTDAGAAHPVLGSIGRRAFFAHSDTFEVPPGGVLLAETPAYPAAFELGSALAIQPHLETTAEVAVEWANHPDFHMLDEVGVALEDFEADMWKADPDFEVSARSVFTAWLDRLG